MPSPWSNERLKDGDAYNAYDRKDGNSSKDQQQSEAILFAGRIATDRKDGNVSKDQKQLEAILFAGRIATDG